MRMLGLGNARKRQKKVQAKFDTLVRTQIARGLAERFFERGRPYEKSVELKRLLSEGLMTRRAFIHKPSYVLKFYQRLFSTLEREPRSVLEIGVKGGASAVFWKALFPSATVVGFDLRIKPDLPSSGDGVIYVEGDRSDRASLEAVVAKHGGFDIIIDNSSQLIEHQVLAARTLLRHTRPGGVYVVESVHAKLKRDGHEQDYGDDDIWADFVFEIFRSLQTRDWTAANTPGGKLARELRPLIEDVSFKRRVLALHRKNNSSELPLADAWHRAPSAV